MIIYILAIKGTDLENVEAPREQRNNPYDKFLSNKNYNYSFKKEVPEAD